MAWKPTKQLTKTISATAEADQVSSFVVDPTALRHAVQETVVETRGEWPIYRVGDVLKSIRGQVFHRCG